MICQFCQGQRLIQVRGRVQPCEECGGKGEIHCCEGLQTQPEKCGIELLPKPSKPQVAEKKLGRQHCDARP
jgi:hypothetical protein